MQQWYGAQMLVASDIAQNYFTVRSLQQRIKIGDHTVATLQQLKRYAQGRFRAGQITDYDVKDVDAKLTAVQAQLATLQAQADAYQRNIAVLTTQKCHKDLNSQQAHKISCSIFQPPARTAAVANPESSSRYTGQTGGGTSI